MENVWWNTSVIGCSFAWCFLFAHVCILFFGPWTVVLFAGLHSVYRHLSELEMICLLEENTVGSRPHVVAHNLLIQLFINSMNEIYSAIGDRQWMQMANIWKEKICLCFFFLFLQYEIAEPFPRPTFLFLYISITVNWNCHWSSWTGMIWLIIIVRLTLQDFYLDSFVFSLLSWQINY